MKTYLYLTFIFVSFTAFSQNQSEIGLRNGKTLYPQSIVYKTPVFKQSFLLVNGEEKIELGQVDYYQTGGFYYKISSIYEGLRSFDNARLKRIANGVIEAYEHQYTVTNYSGGGMNGMPMHNTSTVINYYYSKNGSLEKINDRILRELVSDDQRSVKMLDKKKNQKFVNAGIYAVGGIVIIAGLAKMASAYSDDNNNGNIEDTSISIPPAVFIGAAIMWVPWIIRQARADKLSTPAILNGYNARN